MANGLVLINEKTGLKLQTLHRDGKRSTCFSIAYLHVAVAVVLFALVSFFTFLKSSTECLRFKSYVRSQIEAPTMIASPDDDSVMVVKGFEEMERLQWFAAPDSWPVEDGIDEGIRGSWEFTVEGGHQQLVLNPPSKKDFWRKTYYDPLLVKDDGSFLYAEVDSNNFYTVETTFDLFASSIHQFDQAGIMIRLDEEHWIKAGIEVVEGKPRLSVVVTNSYSDWSTQAWSDFTVKGVDSVIVTARIRVHCRGTNFVVEAWTDNRWEFVRICHLSRNLQSIDDPLNLHPTVISSWRGASAPLGKFWAGVFGACPQQAGAQIKFIKFSITKGSHFEHNADDVK